MSYSIYSYTRFCFLKKMNTRSLSKDKRKTYLIFQSKFNTSCCNKLRILISDNFILPEMFFFLVVLKIQGFFFYFYYYLSLIVVAVVFL